MIRICDDKSKSFVSIMTTFSMLIFGYLIFSSSIIDAISGSLLIYERSCSNDTSLQL